MERVLTYEEKIKKAEEIYARRNQNGVRHNVATVNIRENRKKIALKKMLLQMLICVGIYGIFYLIHTTDYAFSENVRGNTREILSYDIDLVNIYETTKGYIENFLNKNKQEDVLGVTENIEKQEDNIEEQTENGEETIVEQTQNENENVVQQEVPLSQMEIDANQIKQNYSLILPVSGVISSEFGERQVNNALITPEHYGIDIAADEGTQIVSAMEGEVTTASTSQSFGNFLKIQNNNVEITYAHCNELLVTQGAKVGQGEPIATVGHTGEATGSHLHFEIRLDDRPINPRYILNF